MALPLYDTFSVIWIRLSEGRSIFVGDRRHFSHRLLDLGLSVPKTVGVIYLAELAMGLGATLLIFLPWTVGLLVVGQSLIVFTIITLLEHAGRQRQQLLLAQKDAPPPPPSTPPTTPTPPAPAIKNAMDP
jgi:UDP-GlcNAc:undecaprenyl-phosphate GlcNAc-1-phosphate transferase